MKKGIFILTGMALLAAETTSAAVTLFDVPDHTTFFESHGNGMVGYNFEILKPVTVTAVGWYDHDGDGLSRNYRIGLWSSTSGFEAGQPVETVISSLGIFVSSASPLVGSWRTFELPTPVVLQPGVTYQLAGLDSSTSTDPIRYIVAGENQYNTEFTKLGSFFYPGSTPTTFGFTTREHFYLANGFELGPMLFTVPEPSACGLAVMGFMVVLWRRRPSPGCRRPRANCC